MAVEVVMPRLGWGGEEGSLVEWIKQEGESVKPGDVICTVEGDKAVNEVESLDSGILRIPPNAPKPGAKVPVGTVLAYLVQPGEAVPFESVAAGSSVPAASEAAPVASSSASPRPATTPPTSRTTRRGTPPISPRARRVADELELEWQSLVGSGSSGRIVERDVRRAAADRAVQRPEIRISPLARRLAAETGVDVEALAQTRPGRQITRADVEAAAAVPLAASVPPPPSDEGRQRIPFSGVRRVTAERLSQSARATVPVTLTTDADATALVRLREQIKADLAGTNQPIPSYTDLLAKLVALALREHPALNAALDGEEIIQHHQVNLGLAVDTERGLLVPVLHDVASKPLGQVTEESVHLITRARAGQITAEELRGGTFTLTNLGMYDIDAFTPVINLPEAAILGIGRIVARAVVIDEETEQIAVRKVLALSLTFDHRLVDGAPAARFLQRVRYLVAHPTIGLLR